MKRRQPADRDGAREAGRSDRGAGTTAQRSGNQEPWKPAGPALRPMRDRIAAKAPADGLKIRRHGGQRRSGGSGR